MISRKFLTKLVALSVAFIIPFSVFADGMDPDFEPSITGSKGGSSKTVASSDWNYGLAPGVSLLFFDKEDTQVAPALQFNMTNESRGINLSLGIQGGNHLNLHQDAAASVAEFPGKTPQITFVRIPLGIEYIVPLGEGVDLYLGGGPDIIHTANDQSETEVGGHLGARIGYKLSDNWSLSVEAGYLWAEIDSDTDQDIDLDSAYITPLLNYAF